MEEEQASTKNDGTIKDRQDEDAAPLIESSHNTISSASISTTTTTPPTPPPPQQQESQQTQPKLEYKQHPKLTPLQWWILLFSDTFSDISNYGTTQYQRYIHPTVSLGGQYYLPFFFPSSSSSIPPRRRTRTRKYLHPKNLFLTSILLFFLIQKIKIHQTRQKLQSCQLGQEQSFGYFASIPQHLWNKKRRRVQEAQRHAFPEDVLRFIDEPNAWYHNNWDPDFTCQHERKLGGLGDGPKWVCDPHRLGPSILYRQNQNKLQYQSDANALSTIQQKTNDGCLIYSIGINNDGLNFEHEILEIIHESEIGCEIHVFDPQSDKFANEIMYSSTLQHGSSITFHPWGIKGSTDVKDPYRFKSFQDTVKTLQHVGRTIDIMKVDCKMCEWGIYKDWFDPTLNIPRIGQILVEVHGSPEHVVNDFFEVLVEEEGYVIFHKEANTEFYGGTCQEYAFLKLRSDFFEVEG